MKYLLTFILTFFVTLAALFAVPSIQAGLTKRLLMAIEENFGIEVRGESTWTYLPFQLHLNHVKFDALQAEQVHIGFASVSIEHLQVPELGELNAKGSWWLDTDLRPLGTLEVNHPDFGDLEFSFFFQSENKKRELALNLSAHGAFGQFEANGTVAIPKMGLKTAIFEGRSLFARFKMHWNHAEWGSALGYATLGWENLGLTLPSLEIAGTFLDTPFMLEGTGDVQHPLIDLTFCPATGPLNKSSLALSLYRDKNMWAGHGTLEGMLDAHPFLAHCNLCLSDYALIELKEGAFSFDDLQGIFASKWAFEKENTSWSFSGSIPSYTILNEEFKDLSLHAEGIFGDLAPLHVEAYQNELPIQLDGQVALSLNGFHLFLHKLQGCIHGLPLSLEETACLSFFGNGWNADRLHLQAGDCVVKVNGHGTEGVTTLKGSVKGVQGFDLPLFPLSGNFNALIASGTGLFEGQFEGRNGEALQGDLSIDFSQHSALDGHLSFKGELSPYLSIILPDTTSISGSGFGEFTIKGTLNDPLFGGKLSLRKGIYEDLVTGMLYREMETDFILKGTRVKLSKLRALDLAGGMILGEGEMTLTKEIPFVLDLESINGQVIQLEYADATATGRIRLTGNREGGIFEGELKIDEATVKLPEKTPLLFQKIDIVYERIEPQEEKTPWKLAWDLNIDFQSGVKVTSGVLKSEWKGNVAFQGTTDAPLLFGKGALVKADFNFNGKNFESTDGVILFQGEPGSKTSFYITAKQEVEDLKVEIILKGPLKSPEIAFRSNPPKPTKEILSYLLLNKGTGSDEVTLLAESSIKLENTNIEQTLLDKFKSKLGIDRIEISGDEEETLSVEIGKYILPSLYFCLKKSVADGPNQAAIVAKFPHHFKAQGEVGDDAEGKFMLKWERDY